MQLKPSATTRHKRSRRNPLKRAADPSTEDRFRNLIEHLHAGVALLGPRAEVQYANQAAAELFGITLQQALGKTSADLIETVYREDGSEYPFELRPGPRSIETGKPVLNEVMGFRRPDNGELTWIYCSSVPQFGSDGRLTQLIMTFTEITDRKRIEEELHELSGRLLGLQEEEHRRIARDLHDSFAQTLMGISLNLSRLSKGARAWSADDRRALAEARKMTKSLAQQTRSLSYLLHPPLLDEMGLVAAIEDYARGYSKRSGIQLSLDLPAKMARLPRVFESAIFRVIQEALGNIQKHSGSTVGVIRIKCAGGRITLEVSDEGRGLPEKAAKKTAGELGVGILGMRERLRQLGGRLEVASTNPGAVVRATLPLPAEAR